jgi:hypothetical protein
MNKSILTGYLMYKVELRPDHSGKKAGTFTLAVSKRKKGDAIVIPIVT